MASAKLGQRSLVQSLSHTIDNLVSQNNDIRMNALQKSQINVDPLTFQPNYDSLKRLVDTEAQPVADKKIMQFTMLQEELQLDDGEVCDEFHQSYTQFQRDYAMIQRELQEEEALNNKLNKQYSNSQHELFQLIQKQAIYDEEINRLSNTVKTLSNAIQSKEQNLDALTFSEQDLQSQISAIDEWITLNDVGKVEDEINQLIQQFNAAGNNSREKLRSYCYKIAILESRAISD